MTRGRFDRIRRRPIWKGPRTSPDQGPAAGDHDRMSQRTRELYDQVDPAKHRSDRESEPH